MSELECGGEILEEDTSGFDGEVQKGEQETGGTAAVQLEQLLAAVGALQEQFAEKIAVDAHKNTLFDKMHEELVRYQNGVLDRLVESMALDIIQLVDSTKQSVSFYEEKEVTEDSYKSLLGVVKGIIEDLGDILYRQSIETYQVAGDEVNVRRQKIIQTIPTDDCSKENLVAERTADGYEKEGKVLRPERIKIFKYVPANAGDK